MSSVLEKTRKRIEIEDAFDRHDAKKISNFQDIKGMLIVDVLQLKLLITGSV